MELAIKGFELSPLQKKAWRQGEKGRRLFSQALFMISGLRHPAKARERLLCKLEEQDIFRTHYRQAVHQHYPLQVTGERPAYRITDMDWSSQESLAQVIAIEQLYDSYLLSAPEEDITTRIAIVRMSDDVHALLIRIETIAGDAGVLNNLAAVFAGEGLAGDDGDSCPFVQYAEWQQQLLQEKETDAVNFWQGRSYENTAWRQLPFNSSYPEGCLPFPSATALPQLSNIRLPLTLVSKLEHFCNGSGRSEETVLRTAWAILLASYLDHPGKLHMTVTDSGRDEAAFAAINGLLSKNLPFCVSISREQRVKEVLDAIAAEMEAGDAWKDYYFPDAEEEKDGAILFEYRKRINSKSADVALSTEKMFLYTDVFSLKLLVQSSDLPGTAPEIGLYRHPALLNQQEADLICARFVRVLDQVVTDSNLTIAELDIAAPGEYAHLDATVPDGGLGFASVAALFESIAGNMGDHIAAGYLDEEISYATLNERANAYAGLLIDQYGVTPGDRVAFQLPRSLDLLYVMLGILKAGAVFLPLDNGLPYERLKYILQDSKAKVLITPEMLLTEWETGTADPGVSLTPDDPAYLIYTSGSTGKPKGVLVPHRGLLNYSRWFSTTYGVGEKDSAVLFSSIAFDLGFTNLWPLLLSGGAVYLQEESALLDTAALSRLLLDKHISVLKLTPSHFSLLLQTPGFIDSIPELALRLIVLGGEESRLQDIETYFRLQPAITFVNHYGPTETTIGTASKRIDRDSWKSFARRPVIGKPVAGNEILILDAQNRVLPFGLTGEIAVGGEGLAIGYLGNETLTQEKFIPHPLRPGKRLYKTGDLGRLTLKGDIQFLGRRDFQVKMRGYRIELEEIRLVLADYPGIGEAAVLYLQEGPGSGNLAAYFTVTAGFDKAGLSDHLSRHLPAYMLPSYFIPVDILPLTPNGKIDRNALLALPLEKNTSTGYIAPEKDIEKQIAGIWKDLLEVERVGVEDNFFDLGGNSLKLIIMLRSLSALFPGKVTLTDLFRYNTISSIIRHLGEEEEKEELVSYEI